MCHNDFKQNKECENIFMPELRFKLRDAFHKCHIKIYIKKIVYFPLISITIRKKLISVCDTKKKKNKKENRSTVFRLFIKWNRNDSTRVPLKNQRLNYTHTIEIIDK